MGTAEKLLSLKENIEEAKTKKATTEGHIQALTEQLKKHGCNNIEEAKQKLEDLRKEISALEKEIAEGVEKLKEQYDW